MCMCISMCMLNRRVQLLFSKDQWNKVVKSAKAQNISAGEFIRRVVDKYSEVKIEVSEEKRSTPFNRLFKPR